MGSGPSLVLDFLGAGPELLCGVVVGPGPVLFVTGADGSEPEFALDWQVVDFFVGRYAGRLCSF